MKSPAAITALFALAVVTAIERAALGQEPEQEPEPAPVDASKLWFSGYAQIDWVIHNQTSQDEVDHSTGLPLNQDRFILRRGHVRLDAEERLLAAALEIDLNTVTAPQVRPEIGRAHV